MACPSFIHVTADRQKDRLVITRCVLDHNHDRNENLFLHYPEQRRVSPEQKEVLMTLSKLCVAPAAISKHIFHLHGKCLTVKDVQNIRRHDTRNHELGDILEVLEEICSANENNVVVVNSKEDGEIQGVFFQTADQRNLLKKYPEVVHVDGTYRVNNRKLTLYVALVEDGNGKGAAIAYALLCSETKECIEFFINALKSNNETAVGETKCFIIDKDFTEFAILSKEFPSAHIQLCLFHVMKTFRVEINKLKVDETLKEKVRNCVQEIVYANTEERYSQLMEKLRSLSPDSFFNYFCHNWDSCKELWATFLTKSLPNFQTRTNNRIERHNQELKKVLNSHMTVADCIRAIVGKVDEQTSRHVHRSIVSLMCKSYNVQDKDSQVQQIRNLATEYAANLIIKQYEKAKGLKAVANVHMDDSVVSVTIGGDMHTVTREPQASCSCSFWQSLHLPCKHFFVMMFTAQLQFDETWVPMRWRKSYPDIEKAIFNGATSTSRPVLTTSQSTGLVKLSRTEKFNKMKRVLLEIGDLCSEVSHEEFQQRYEQILKLKAAWMEGSIVSIGTDVDVDQPLADSHVKDSKHAETPVEDPGDVTKSISHSSTDKEIKVEEMEKENKPASDGQQTDPREDDRRSNKVEPPSSRTVGKPVKSYLKRKNTDGLYLPRFKKVKGRPKGCNTSVIGVTFKSECNVKPKSCDKVHLKHITTEKVQSVYGEQELVQLLQLIKTITIARPKGVHECMNMITTKVMSPANGIIYEAGQDEEQLDVLADALSPFTSSISGPSPQRNVDLYQLLISAAYMSLRYDLDLSSLEEMLSCKPSHLATVSESSVNDVNEKMKVGNNCFTKTDLATLTHGKWLNDRVIHSYLGLLMMEHPGKVYVLPSFLAVKWDKGQYQQWLYGKNAEAIVSGTKPAVMRQHHCHMYRQYVRKRLLGIATRNKDIMCDLPFCLKPSGKISWVLCEHCDRWCHYVCCNVTSVDKDKAFKCILCKHDEH